jgi:hypothetical protein
MNVPPRCSNRRSNAGAVPKLARGIILLAAAAAMTIGLATGSGCGHSPTRVPTTPPDITGEITAVDPAGERIGTIRVEAAPQDSSGSAKAVVRVSQVTTVFGPGGRTGSFATLEVGQSVRVWFSGAVRESYPLQAAAATVVVDHAAP